MQTNETRPESPEERYCEMLRAYYERLKKDREQAPSANAIEEVKLRLFLSLLDRTREAPSAERFNGSPL